MIKGWCKNHPFSLKKDDKMNIKELQDIIKNNFFYGDKIISKKVSKKSLSEDCNKEIVKIVNDTIKNDFSFAEKLRLIVFNDGLTCKQCGSDIDKPKTHKVNYYACSKCIKMNANASRKETVSKKYGVDTIAKLDVVKKKREDTVLKKYGVTNPMKSDEIKDKLKTTIQEKYGVEHPMHLDSTKDKIKKTNLDKYGVEFQFQNEDVKRKIKETNVLKYGVEHPIQSKCIKEKTNKTNIKKYGYDNIFKIYGVNKMLNGDSNKLQEYLDVETVKNLYNTECNKNLTTLGEYFNTSVSTMSAYFKRNNLEINYKYSKSNAERSLVETIKAWIPDIEIIENSRNIITPLELDIYLPEYKIAIEYCGAYWHSELFKDNKNYHYEKWKLCKNLGIQLLTIWDYEYNNRTDQILSFIKSKLGVFSERIYARKCEFRKIDERQYDFFEKNHIQGRPSSIDQNFGLFYNNELVGCVSYSTHHRDYKKYTLNRLAFKSGIQVIGGVGKLIKTSLKMVGKDVITWSDNRFSTGNIYEKNGFLPTKELKPDYCYFDIKTNSIKSKQSQQKKNIGCPSEITEREYCYNNGLYRLWDCGKRSFTYTN